jgi:hypothetical protein
MMTLMIPQEEMKKYVHVKTVGRKELETHTQHGWRLIGTVAEESYEVESNYGGSRNILDDYLSAIQNLQYHRDVGKIPEKPKPSNRTFFLIGLGESETIIKLAEERDEALNAEKAAVNRAYDADAKKNTAEKEMKRWEEVVAAERADGKKTAERFSELEVKQRKLEGDLLKVRTAVGELKWKEIVC